MIHWIPYQESKPPVGTKVIIARRDYGYSNQHFDYYFAKLVHPFSTSKRYNPDWYHWVVMIDDKEQIFEIAGEDVWSDINEPETAIYRIM